MFQPMCTLTKDVRKHNIITMHESDSLKLGDSVFALNFGTGQKSLAGIVVTVKGQSCMAELADERNIRRHLDRICPCSVHHPSSAVSNNELLEVPMTADSSAEEVNTAELPAMETVRRPPDHFGFSYY